MGKQEKKRKAKQKAGAGAEAGGLPPAEHPQKAGADADNPEPEKLAQNADSGRNTDSASECQFSGNSGGDDRGHPDGLGEHWSPRPNGGGIRSDNRLIAQSLRWRTNARGTDFEGVDDSKLPTNDVAIKVARRNMLQDRDLRASNDALRVLRDYEAQNQRDDLATDPLFDPRLRQLREAAAAVASGIPAPTADDGDTDGAPAAVGGGPLVVMYLPSNQRGPGSPDPNLTVIDAAPSAVKISPAASTNGKKHDDDSGIPIADD